MYKSVANASTVANGSGAPVVEPRSTDSEATKSFEAEGGVGKSCRAGLLSKKAVAGVQARFVAEALVENVAALLEHVEEEEDDDEEKARRTA